MTLNVGKHTFDLHKYDWPIQVNIDLHRSGLILPVGFPQSLSGRGFVVSSHLFTGLVQGGFEGN